MAKRTANTAQTIIQNLTIRPVNRSSVDINIWRNAHKAAESEIENRKPLYELYEDLLVDGHLKSLVEKRAMAITNSEIIFTKDGKTVEEMLPFINSEAFNYLLKELVMTRIYGHTLLELQNINDIISVNLVDRRHVKPRKGLVVANPTDTNGIHYRELPWLNFLVEAGRPDDFGLLLQAAQYVIYKRGGRGDWADLMQLFGVPFRHAKYNNEESRKILEEAMEAMGSSGWAVTPSDASIELVRAEGISANSSIFTDFINNCNDELSVLILGQTMTTTDSKNSGFAQGKVHGDVEEEIHKDDMQFVLRILNSRLSPVLINLGLPADGGEWRFAEHDNLSLQERLNIDNIVNNKVPISVDYWYERYGIPKPEGEDVTGGQYVPDPHAKPPADEIKQADASPTFMERLFSFFVSAPEHSGAILEDLSYGDLALAEIPNQPRFEAWKSKIDIILEKYHAGKMSPAELDEELFLATSDAMFEASSKAGLNLKSIAYDHPDYTMLSRMRGNTFYFAGAKTYQQLKAMNDLLIKNGKVIPFNEFRKNIADYRREALGIFEKYNKQYLQTEYNQAVISSQAAANWARYLDNADIFPNLKYFTAGDERVRESHRSLDGIIKPIHHPFWRKYYPPNDWGCRCYVEPTSDPEDKRKIPDINNKPMFNNNIGKTGELWYKHPYFERNKTEMPEVFDRVDGFTQAYKVEMNLKSYNLEKEIHEVVIPFNNKSGGYCLKEEDVSLNKKELIAAQKLVNNGERVRFKAKAVHDKTKKEIERTKNPDCYINDVVFDIKTTEGNTKNTLYNNIRDESQARFYCVNCDSMNLGNVVDGVKESFRKSNDLYGLMIIKNNNVVLITKRDYNEGIIDELLNWK